MIHKEDSFGQLLRFKNRSMNPRITKNCQMASIRMGMKCSLRDLTQIMSSLIKGAFKIYILTF